MNYREEEEIELTQNENGYIGLCVTLVVARELNSENVASFFYFIIIFLFWIFVFV